MKKLLIASIVIAALLCTTSPAAIERLEGGIIFELKNTSQDVKVARVFWVDHPFRHLGPVSMCVGEISPGESFVAGESSGGYNPGIYIFSWELCHRLYQDRDLERTKKKAFVPPGVSKVTITDKFEMTMEARE